MWALRSARWLGCGSHGRCKVVMQGCFGAMLVSGLELGTHRAHTWTTPSIMQSRHGIHEVDTITNNRQTQSTMSTHIHKEIA
jgi:hypothetical protein